MNRLLAVLLSLTSAAALAAPSDLDPSFNPGGAVPGFLTAPLTTRGGFADVLPLADGRVLLVSDNGPSGTTNSVPGAVMLNGDGSVDTGFATNGVFSQDVISGVNVQGFTKVRQAADGGFVTLTYGGNTPAISLIKLTAAGALDASFGTGGRVTLPANVLPGPGSSFQSTSFSPPIEIDSQGRILFASGYRRPGVGGPSIVEVPVICRFTANGLLDTSYSADADGIDGCLVATGAELNDQIANISAMALDGDAAIIGGAAVVNNQGGVFGALKATASGAPDAGFGSGGIIRSIPLGNGFGAALGLVRRANGRLLFAFRPGSGAAALLQLLPDGTLDTSFGDGDGVVSRTGTGDIDSLPGNARTAQMSPDIRGLILQPDGRAIMLARVSVGGADPFTGAQVARYLENGLPDLGFGELSAFVRGPEQSITATQNALVLAPDGAIYVAGGRGGLIANPSAPFVARLLGGESRPTAVTPFELADQVGVPQASIRTSDAITIAGLPDGQPALVRVDLGSYLINGSSASGLNVVYNGDTVSARHTAANTPGTRTVQYLQVSTATDEVGEFFISTTAGELACRPADFDPAFAVADPFGPGLTVFQNPALADLLRTHSNSLALRPDGSLVSHALTQTNGGFGVDHARIDASGVPDPVVAGSGFRRLTDIGGAVPSFDGNTASRHEALLRLPNGQFLALISVSEGGQSLVLTRLNFDGSVDPTFGTAGRVTYGRAALGLSTTNTTFRDPFLSRQPNGQILAALAYSNSFTASERGFALIRFNADGSLDDDFAAGNISGVPGVALVRRDPAPQGPVIALDGERIVVMTFDGNQDYRVHRFDGLGRFDGSFGVGGIALVTTANSNFSSLVGHDLAVLGDGRIVFSTRSAALGRLTADGTLDADFGDGGLVLRDRGGAGGIGARGIGVLTSDLRDLEAQRLAAQADGKIVVLGSDFGSGTGQRRFHIARFFADGLPDTGFGNDRSDLIPLRSAVDLPLIEPFHRNLAIDDAGRIVFSAHFNVNGGPGVPTPEDANRLIVGRLCGGESLSTRVSDFVLDDLEPVPPSTLQTSNTVTISGLAAGLPALIRVDNGEYALGCDPAAFTTAMEKVFNGDTVCVRHTSAASGTMTTTLILGAGPDEFREDFITDTGVVVPPNVAPVAIDDSAETPFETAVVVDVLANDSDADGDPLTIASFTTGGNGAVALVGGALRYTPNAGFSGSDAFTYTAADGNGGSASATVRITVLAAPPPPPPPPGNTLPVAAADSATTDAGRSVVIDVLANDRDDDSDPLSIVSFSAAANGRVEFAETGLRYTPNASFSGTDRFTYTISDGRDQPTEAFSGGTAEDLRTATVTITVRPVVEPRPEPPVDDDTVSGDARRGGGSAGAGWLAFLAVAALARRGRAALRPVGGLLLAALVMLPVTARAESGVGGRWYAGGLAALNWSGQQGDPQRAVNLPGTTASAAPTTNHTFSWGVHAGYRWTPSLATEIGYDNLGRYSARFAGRTDDAAAFGTAVLNAVPIGGDAYSLRLRLDQPLIEAIDGYARLGGYYGHSERRLRINGRTLRGNDDLFGITAGLGLRHQIGRHLGVFIETSAFWPERGKHGIRFGSGLEWRF